MILISWVFIDSVPRASAILWSGVCNESCAGAEGLMFEAQKCCFEAGVTKDCETNAFQFPTKKAQSDAGLCAGQYWMILDAFSH